MNFLFLKLYFHVSFLAINFNLDKLVNLRRYCKYKNDKIRIYYALSKICLLLVKLFIRQRKD